MVGASALRTNTIRLWEEAIIMKSKLTLIIGLAFCASLVSMAIPAEEESGFLVIVNQDNSSLELQKDLLTDVFLKKVERWKDGAAILPVDLPKESTTRQLFTAGVMGRSPEAVNRYWNHRVFGGKGVPPVVLANDADVVSYVSRNTGAIGYVSPDAPLSGVRVISVAE